MEGVYYLYFVSGKYPPFFEIPKPLHCPKANLQRILPPLVCLKGNVTLFLRILYLDLS
jgi:hypothetical protein